MRNLKKLLALIVAICVLATFTVPAFAADATLAADTKTLADIGVLVGQSTATGVTAEYGATTPTRIQAAVMLLRLTGNLAEAQAFTGEDNFADAGKATWAKPLMAYLKANPELGFVGVGDNNFAPNDTITAQQYYKVVLTALGYAIPADYAYADTLTFAKDTAKLSLGGDAASFTVNALATATVEGLKAAVKGGTKILTATLVEAGKLDKAAAITAGLYVEAVTATAKASGAKLLEVTFSKAVDTAKATFAVKKGSVTMAVSKVAWNDAKTVATITLVSALVDGDYVITVGGLDLAVTAYTVTATASKVASIAITSDIAPIVASTNDVTFAYVVKNQYGEDVTAATTNLTWTPSTGTLTADPANKTAKVTFLQLPVKDTVFVVTAIEPVTGVYATKSLKVGDAAKVAKINVLGLYNADNKTLYTNSTYADFYVKVEGFDQYGNKVGIAALNDTAQTTVVPSNTSVVAKGAFVVIDSATALKLAEPVSKVDGTAVINFISNITGQSSSITITVAKAANLDALTLSVPADLVVKGESVKVPFTAVDQYGVELSETAKGALVKGTDLTLTSTDSNIGLDFSYNYETKKAELTLNASNALVTTGSKVIMAVSKTGKVSQITVDVKAVATPSTVSAVKDAATKMTVGGVSTLSKDNIVVIDQYGRTMDLNTAWFATYDLKLVSGTPANVTLGALDVIAVEGDKVTATGLVAGSSTISISVVGVVNSTFEFTAETVAKSVITEYVVEAPATLYAATTHDKAFTVYGKTASGAKVAISTADYIATSNLTNVTVNKVAGTISANGAATGWAADTDKTATVLVIIDGANGPQSVTKTITVTNKAPVLTTLSVDATVYLTVATAGTAATKFTGKDQYDVTFAPVITNVLYTNVSSGVTIGNNGLAAPTVTGAAAGASYQVTIVTANGLTKSTNVVVKP